MSEKSPTGWPVLHLFYRIDRHRYLELGSDQRKAAIAELRDLLRTLEAEDGLQLILTGVVGKADFGVMAVHPEIARIQRLTQQIAATRLGACLECTFSFLSMSEVSEYMTTAGDHARKLLDEDGMDPASPDFSRQVGAYAKRMAAYADSRVHPKLPAADYSVVCFYPMSKARGERNNWFALAFPERKRLMISHGEAGRRYADRVTQLVTSSTGLDDWEWGVTLFAREMKSIRDIVYEMRYDEGSALYGQFGGFFIGVRFAPDALAEALNL